MPKIIIRRFRQLRKLQRVDLNEEVATAMSSKMIHWRVFLLFQQSRSQMSQSFLSVYSLSIPYKMDSRQSKMSYLNDHNSFRRFISDSPGGLRGVFA